MENSKKLEMRNLIPVVGTNSVGKSNLLNVLFNIDFLEIKEGVATKFVNILRYNPTIKEPQFYHLLVQKDGNKYNFYKDNSFSVIIGNQNIIEQNKIINHNLSKQKNIDYENIFYMTEINESPFIKDEKYLLSHDFCDIPGLSEAMDNNDDLKLENKKEKDDDTIPKDNIERINCIRAKLGIIKKNNVDKIKKVDTYYELPEIKDLQKDVKTKDVKEEDDIYYNVKVEKNSYIYNIFNIIKDVIDEVIIILCQDKYYFKENFNIIALLHKIIKKKNN